MGSVKNDQTAAGGGIVILIPGLNFINRGNYHYFRFFTFSQGKNEILHPLSLVPECLSKRKSLSESGFYRRIPNIYNQISQFETNLNIPAKLQ